MCLADTEKVDENVKWTDAYGGRTRQCEIRLIDEVEDKRKMAETTSKNGFFF